jgi:hypothetical protein
MVKSSTKGGASCYLPCCPPILLQATPNESYLLSLQPPLHLATAFPTESPPQVIPILPLLSNSKLF